MYLCTIFAWLLNNIFIVNIFKNPNGNHELVFVDFDEIHNATRNRSNYIISTYSQCSKSIWQVTDAFRQEYTKIVGVYYSQQL